MISKRRFSSAGSSKNRARRTHSTGCEPCKARTRGALPFPLDILDGPFDQRWTWQEDWVAPTWIGPEAKRAADRLDRYEFKTGRGPAAAGAGASPRVCPGLFSR